DEKLAAVPRRVSQRFIQRAFILHDENADARAFPRCFDREGQRQSRASPSLDNLKWRCRHAAFLQASLRRYLIDRQFAAGDALACIANAALLEDPLNLSVFSESAVDDIECDVDSRWHGEIRTRNVHWCDVGSQRTDRLDDAFTRFERDGAFGAGSAHEDG